jgi:hypothetical protein
LSNGVVGHWLPFTVATTFLQWLADAKKGLLRSLMKIAGLHEEDL